MSAPLVVVHRDATVLAQAVAARIVTALVDAQADHGAASIVLTGGGIGIATLRELGEMPAREAIDWSALSVWWGDERFLPTGHPDRNETQARAALLDLVDLDPARVHPMPASDGPEGEDLDAAAAAYAVELAANPDAAGFDVLLLGIGPDAHVASLFPGSPEAPAGASVVAVRGAPKPPPSRVSLSMATINSAREAWLIAAGEEKAAAVRTALGASGASVPAGQVRARDTTRWLVDRAAASQLTER
ncbi:MAG TPA: 6-phosphogluconolactonase [Mycobacteriales bacterium]|nr:6-phosphogluconolactonase [Mycobacteriales bacterium]